MGVYQNSFARLVTKVPLYVKVNSVWAKPFKGDCKPHLPSIAFNRESS